MKRSSVKYRSRYKATREGKRFILATILIAFAALNTGNNLIFLILSMMLSFLVLSIAILRVNMHGLTLSVFQNRPAYAGSPADISATITNRKKFFPAYSINVCMRRGKKNCVPLPHIPRSSEASANVPVLYKRRGLYRFGDFILESSFPFILFSRVLSSDVKGGILVYPGIKEMETVLPELAAESYDLLHPSARLGDEFSRIREFRYGDDRRRIHWKTSAKTEKVMVAEYAAEESRWLTIVLDNLKPPDEEAFEKSIVFAASAADRFLKEGYFVRLLTCKKLIPFGAGGEHLFKILDVLALIKGQDSWECPVAVGPEGVTILILNSEVSPLRRYTGTSNMVVYASDL
ncbi:MAG: DUF58 domain-containing protein [Nitrospirota bacterium]